MGETFLVRGGSPTLACYIGIRETSMTYASCPTVVVNAPIDIVWKLLTQSGRFGDFFDLRITGVEPAGPAVIGQRFCGESGPRFLHFGLQFEFTEVNAAEQLYPRQ